MNRPITPPGQLLNGSGLAGKSPATSEVQQVFLHAGHVFTASRPTEITTILGSCVAICIWDPLSRVGGMNHFMLPYDIGANFGTPRFAQYATTLLLEQLVSAGAERSRLRAKIFGGACVLGEAADSQHDLGSKNVCAARERLRAEGILIVEADTGGAHGRKLLFQSATGETTVTKVSRVIG